MTLSKLALSVVLLALVACGGSVVDPPTSSSSGSPSPSPGETSPTPPQTSPTPGDTAPSPSPTTSATTVPVTGVVGHFHRAGIDEPGSSFGGGSEYNLEIRSNHTWAVREYLSGGGGGGGGCAAGTWTSGKDGFILQPAAEQASFAWNYSSSVDLVEVTIVNGVLHTVASGSTADQVITIDFEPEFRCFDRDTNAYASCSTLPNQC